MSNKEYTFLQKQLLQTGQTQQSYILNAIRGATIASLEEVKELQKLNKAFADMMRQLRGLATNVNQMAHVQMELVNSQWWLPWRSWEEI